MFKKYQHIERFGTEEVQGIEVGECHVFYKIDGTNGSVWLGEDGDIKAGSRNRELTLEDDNAGFYAHVLSDKRYKNYFQKHPQHRLYGEWLVPHSLKTYRDNAWRRFYVFDVCLDKDDGSIEYLRYDIYKPLLEEFGIDYIPALAIVKNASYDDFVKLLDKTGEFLVKDGQGKGEGLVIKNYDWYNRYGRQVWAKIVVNEFKELNHKTLGSPVINYGLLIEEKIVNEYITEGFIEKEYSKIVNDRGGWRSQYISELFNRVYYELVREEIWDIIKKHKNPVINFKTLNMFVLKKVKEVKQELFA